MRFAWVVLLCPFAALPQGAVVGTPTGVAIAPASTGRGAELQPPIATSKVASTGMKLRGARVILGR